MPIVFPTPATPSSAAKGDMELIFSETLTADQNSFDTGTLPTGFKSLLIYARCRGDGTNNASAMSLFFNGDLNTNNYQTSRLIHAGGNLSNDSYDVTLVGGAVQGFSSQPRYGTTAIHIIDHESTTGFKSWVSNHQTISRPSGFNYYYAGLYSGVWENSDAITSIKYRFFDPQFDLVAGSSIAVYGLK